MNTAERKSKLCSVADLVEQIPDGARVAFGGFAVYQKPMAVVREIARRHKRRLTIVGTVHSMDADLLIGAGCVDRIETSYVGMEKYGLAPNYRRAVQSGMVTIVQYPEMLAWDRFRADREGWPFWPCYSLGGCEGILESSDIIEYRCPVSGRRAWALPAAKPDVVVIHGYQGDRYGNIQLQRHSMLPQAMDVEMARACRTVLASVENLVENDAVRQEPQFTLIPAFRTQALALVPFGSHPLSTLSAVREDEAHIRAYMEAAKSEETFQEYLEKYIYATKDEEAYQQLIGTKHLQELEEADR